MTVTPGNSVFKEGSLDSYAFLHAGQQLLASGTNIGSHGQLDKEEAWTFEFLQPTKNPPAPTPSHPQARYDRAGQGQGREMAEC